MTRMMEQIQAETGMICTIMLGEPEPREGGKILVMTFHSGKTMLGNDFGDAYKGWYENVELPFTDHVNKVFREYAKVHKSEVSNDDEHSTIYSGGKSTAWIICNGDRQCFHTHPFT
jgi:hypothetical protein